MRAFAPAESHPKPLQSHILGIYKAYTPEYKATPKPPQSLLIANRLGPQSHPKAILKPHQSQGKAKAGCGCWWCMGCFRGGHAGRAKSESNPCTTNIRIRLWLY